jgi:8-oxo-dGTP diphosphatase
MGQKEDNKKEQGKGKKKKGLIIGKFEIVHYGHKEMLEQIAARKDIGEIITAVTTNRRNIFSWEERKGMLESVVSELGKDFSFYNVPDINNPPMYAEHVKRSVNLPNLDNIVLFTGNPYTAGCFEGKCDVELVKINHPYSATRVLEMIGSDDEAWKDQVPKSTREFIEKNNGVEKIKKSFKACPTRQLSPYLTTDAIIEYDDGKKQGIVLIERKNPPYGWALPGGFHEIGLTSKENAMKEAKEETGLDTTILHMLGVYDDPRRDVRAHTVTIVYAAKGHGKLNAGDDAKNAKVFNEDDMPWDKIAFDHAKIIKDYYESMKKNVTL